MAVYLPGSFSPVFLQLPAVHHLLSICGFVYFLCLSFLWRMIEKVLESLELVLEVMKMIEKITLK